MEKGRIELNLLYHFWNRGKILNNLAMFKYLSTILFLILYRRQVVPLKLLLLVQCTLSNSPNYLPSVQY